LFTFDRKRSCIKENIVNLTIRKPTELEKLHTKIAVMNIDQQNEEVNKRLDGINSGLITGSELVKLKEEAIFIASKIIRR